MILSPGQQSDRKGADPGGGPVGDSPLQLQAGRREPVWPGVRVPEPDAAVRVSSAGVPGGRALPEPVLHQEALPGRRGHQDRAQGLGPQDQEEHQEGSTGRGGAGADRDRASQSVAVRTQYPGIHPTVLKLLGWRVWYFWSK